MKIIKENKVLVQLMDLKEILDLETDLDLEIKEIFKKDIEGMTDYSQHSFKEYDNSKIIEYLKKQEWIIDYEVYLTLETEKISKITDKINLEKVRLINILAETEIEYDKVTDEEAKRTIYKKMDTVYKERLKFDYMQDSIDYFLRVKFRQFDLDIKNGLIIK